MVWGERLAVLGRGCCLPDEPSSDKRLELAYEAAQDLLKMQEALLSNTRTRANNLLTDRENTFSMHMGEAARTAKGRHAPSFRP